VSRQGRPAVLASQVAGQVARAQLKSKVTAKRKLIRYKKCVDTSGRKVVRKVVLVFT
jgi:hypothetical protein